MKINSKTALPLNVFPLTSIELSNSNIFYHKAGDKISNIKTAEKGIFSRIFESCATFFKKLFCYLCTSKKHSKETKLDGLVLPKKNSSNPTSSDPQAVSSVKVDKNNYKVVLPKTSNDPVVQTQTSSSSSAKEQVQVQISRGLSHPTREALKKIELGESFKETHKVDGEALWNNYLKACEKDKETQLKWIKTVGWFLFGHFTRRKNQPFCFNNAWLGENDTMIFEEKEKRYVATFATKELKTFAYNMVAYKEKLRAIFADLRIKLKLDPSKSDEEIFNDVTAEEKKPFFEDTNEKQKAIVCPAVDEVEISGDFYITADKIAIDQKMEIKENKVIFSSIQLNFTREYDITARLKTHPIIEVYEDITFQQVTLSKESLEN